MKEVLLKRYQKKGITPAIRMKSNAHNQYPQIYLASGLFGLLIFVASLAVGLLVALKHNNMLYFLFSLLFSFHLSVESMFDRQAGVVFYAFFNSLLFVFSFSRKH